MHGRPLSGQGRRGRQLMEDWVVFIADQRFSGQGMQPCSGTGDERTADHDIFLLVNP